MSTNPPAFHALATGRLDDAGRRVAARARRVLDDLLDEVRRDLVPLAGHAAVSMKSDGTPVTVHDRETDERMVDVLLDAFPDHGALSEEQDHTAPATDWTWVLDPIDGTSNFIAGVPHWCVSVALCLEGTPVLGVVEAPALARRFVAVAGEGAFETSAGRDERLAVRPSVALHDPAMAHVPGLYSGGAARDLYADGVQLNARIMGASALDLALIARGVAPLAVQLGLRVWDVAAGGLLVAEAGGVALEEGPEPVLPLRPGRDYSDVAVRIAAAGDAATAREALEAVERGRAVRRQA